MSDSHDAIFNNTREADLIVVARVVSVGPPPPAWSGIFAAWQRVDYQIVRWLKKRKEDQTAQSIAVWHPVVFGSPIADPTAPRLRESVFRPGAELIIFVRVVDARYEVFDERLGVLPNRAPWLDEIEAAIAQAAKPQQPGR